MEDGILMSTIHLNQKVLCTSIVPRQAHKAGYWVSALLDLGCSILL